MSLLGAITLLAQSDPGAPSNPSPQFWADALAFAGHAECGNAGQALTLQNRMLQSYPQPWVAWLFNQVGYWDPQSGQRVAPGAAPPQTPVNQGPTRALPWAQQRMQQTPMAAMSAALELL